MRPYIKNIQQISMTIHALGYIFYQPNEFYDSKEYAQEKLRSLQF